MVVNCVGVGVVFERGRGLATLGIDVASFGVCKAGVWVLYYVLYLWCCLGLFVFAVGWVGYFAGGVGDSRDRLNKAGGALLD